MTTQRDSFISALFEKAKKDKDVYMISVDMGAASLDIWREELPNQFFAAGISEQHAINFAAGLAATGKKPYVYFMAAWVARCFEQIRYSCAMANNPITILGNGIGLGYTPAGPAHEPTEDIAYMRSLCGIEIYSPANSLFAKKLADLTYNDPKLRYIRLERSYPQNLDGLYDENILTQNFFKKGIAPLGNSDQKEQICLLSSGYMLGRALNLREKLIQAGHAAIVLDLWRIKPLNTTELEKFIRPSNLIITLEEQSLSGGFGSAICELLADLKYRKTILRFGLPERYIFQNASRDYLLDHNGLSIDSLYSRIIEEIQK